MSKFVGLCIGGPLAGNFHSSLAPSFRVERLNKSSAFPNYKSLITHEKVEHRAFSYFWDEGIILRNNAWVNDKRQGFWIPEQHDLEWAVKELLSAYIERNKK